MMFSTNPTPRTFGAVPAGPVRSSEALREGAAALGLSFAIDADGVVISGQRFGSLETADIWLEQKAARIDEQVVQNAIRQAAEHQAAEGRRKAMSRAEDRFKFANAMRITRELL